MISLSAQTCAIELDSIDTLEQFPIVRRFNLYERTPTSFTKKSGGEEIK